MKSYFALGLVTVVFMAVEPAYAAPVTLQNDSFIDGSQAAFNGGFVSGERGAATLGPLAEASTMNNVTFLFGGAASTQTVTLRIYLETGTPMPGTEIFTADYQVQGSDSAFQEIDLTADNISVPANQAVRVAIEVSHSGPPGLAHDDMIQAGRNWLYSGGSWVDFNVVLPGDLIIRAEVDTQGGGTGTATGTGTGTGTGTATGTSTDTGSSTSTGTGTSANACTPGESVACTGPGGCSGGQVCAVDGSGFDSCVCGGASGDGAANDDDGGCAMGATPSQHDGWPLALGLGLLTAWVAQRRRRK